MYEAMRQRAPNSTKLTGAMSAVMLTLAAGYALSNGFGRNIAKLIEPATVVSIVEDTHDTPPPPPTSDLNTKVAIGEAPVPQLPVFVFTPPPDDGGGIIARPGPQTKEAGPAPPPPPAPAPVRKMPKLMPGPKPDYPVREIRAQSQGVTELSVCVAANGRVSSA
ncbi:MAG TPA: hypothetical protein VG960_01090, partial [Caulobacteraceae bacterium]|nr:hypothetical protein [Caulobacteraceae bacterium]